MEKIHIGQLIKQKMEEDGRKVSWLAEKIPVAAVMFIEFLTPKALMQICYVKYANIWGLSRFLYTPKKSQKENRKMSINDKQNVH